MAHTTVLKTEAVDALALNPNSVVFDCTFGAGGHAGLILEKLGKEGHYVGIDLDVKAFTEATLPETEAQVTLIERNFSDIAAISDELQMRPTAILADLGWRTDQFESGGRGFSFKQSEPLLMTYGDPSSYTFTAATIVNEWEETSLIDILRGYGEEIYAKRIASAICLHREEVPIKTSAELAEIVTDALPSHRKRGRIHPATQTFQALRIAVNDELGAVKSLLNDGFARLSSGGRMAIISFHSLEDRLVKRFFKEQAVNQTGWLIQRKPLTATEAELSENPRSRSAKLRIIEKY